MTDALGMDPRTGNETKIGKKTETGMNPRTKTIMKLRLKELRQ